MAGTAKPPVESSAARARIARRRGSKHREPAHDAGTDARGVRTASRFSSADSRFQITGRRIQTSDFRHKSSRDGAQKPLDATSRPSRARRQAKRARSEAARAGPGDAGWVSVPNSGKNLFEDATHADALRDDSSSGMGAESAATRDVRGHAAKDVSFELESPRARATAELEQNGRQSVRRFRRGPSEPRSQIGCRRESSQTPTSSSPRKTSGRSRGSITARAGIIAPCGRRTPTNIRKSTS